MFMRKSISGIVIKEGRKLLLVRKKDIWILPGGKLEPEESNLDCLFREFKEELPDVKINEFYYYGSFKGKTPHKKDRLKTEAYFVNISGEAGKPSGEINDLEWVEDFSNYNISDITNKVIKSLRKKDYL